ncbi:MAG: hypothetical protein QG629_380, partial [Patescibacteria group bacterium]|nr:hypothetical protein [Patescibacteria group bacterium]
MSEQLHSFNLGDNAPHEQLVLDQYSNGAKHMYAIEDGKKIHISQDSVLEAYGFDPNAPQDDRGNSEDVVYSDGAQRLVDHEAAQANDQARLKEHAKWHGRVNTVNTEVDLENGRTSGDVQKDAAAANLSGEDVAYEMWLKENAKDLPKDENGNPVRGVKQSMEARAEALRKEKVREKARLNMRVKTGVATPDEVAYYNDLRDMARVENVGDAHDMALVENERRMNQGRIHDVGEAQEAAIAENEAYNQDAAANAAEEEARQAEAEAVRIAEEGRIEGIRAQREALVAAMEGPRDEYLRRVAGNARRGIHWKKEFRKSGVEEARKEYEEARSRLLGFEAAQIRAIGAGAEGDMGEEAIQTEINDV